MKLYLDNPIDSNEQIKRKLDILENDTYIYFGRLQEIGTIQDANTKALVGFYLDTTANLTHKQDKKDSLKSYKKLLFYRVIHNCWPDLIKAG